MEIYVVQQGDTIQSIADRFGVSVEKLIQDNGLTAPDQLVVGQSIVIAYPQQNYMVKEGDTLVDIATSYNISVIQLLANNPYLSERDYIYPGDIIVISYNWKGTITTHGNTVPYINKAILRKTLPNLTYLSVLNYTATSQGGIVSYYDDTEIIQVAKDYGVAPLMLVTTLSITGTANVGVAYELLLNEKYQNLEIDNILNILKSKGYYGVNFSFEYINVSNMYLYEAFFAKITSRINTEGYQVFLTINPNISIVNNEVTFERVDYSTLNQLANNLIFTSYEWSARLTPPSPISSYYEVNTFLLDVLNYIPSEKVIIGVATIGYDWELPYVAGASNTYNMTLDRANDLARNVGAVISFDEISQTPFFIYTGRENIEHVVWFVNSRSINATLDLVSKYNLRGISVWNINVYTPQLWLIINSQYQIEKVL